MTLYHIGFFVLTYHGVAGLWSFWAGDFLCVGTFAAMPFWRRDANSLTRPTHLKGLSLL